MSGDDLIIVAPWLAFAAGLAVIGWRLAVGRGRRRRREMPPPGDGEADDRPALGPPVARDGRRRDR